MSERSPLRSLLVPLVPLYRAGLALREARLSSGREPVRRLNWPVVSIGNLSTGGAGKTPLVIALAQALSRRGVYVDVLSRGYGRADRAAARVDPDGTAEQFGDEPLVIAREAGVPVYVGAERYEAGMLAEGGFVPPQDRGPAADPAAVHLLDDGFQHRQLARDVDILLLTAEDFQDRLLPAGNLREPLDALQRASVQVIRADEPATELYLNEVLAIDRNSEEPRWTGPVWRLRRKMQVPPLAGPVIAFCGIARPRQFFAGLESAGLQVVSRVAFRDHHRYVQHDIDCLLDAARGVGAAAFVTTEKDRVRMGGLSRQLSAHLRLEMATLRVEIDDEAATIQWLIGRLRSVA